MNINSVTKGKTMARAQFDRNEVIDKSIELFWQNGYGASSMKQIVKNTSLQPGLIYLAFGNKEALFHEALVSYTQKSIATIRKMLDTSPSIGKGICTFFETFIIESTKVNYCGCFLIKIQLELAAEGNKLHEFAAAKLSKIEALPVYRGYVTARECNLLCWRKNIHP